MTSEATPNAPPTSGMSAAASLMRFSGAVHVWEEGLAGKVLTALIDITVYRWGKWVVYGEDWVPIKSS